MMTRGDAVAALARRPDVRRSVGLALERGVDPAHFDVKVPGLLDALGVNRAATKFERRRKPAAEQAVDPYAVALATIRPGRGAYAQVTSLGLDYDEFKRRYEAASEAA